LELVEPVRKCIPRMIRLVTPTASPGKCQLPVFILKVVVSAEGAEQSPRGGDELVATVAPAAPHRMFGKVLKFLSFLIGLI
jgi:hypothetical protein